MSSAKKMDELLPVVDENDIVIDKKPYSICHKEGLTHRSISVVIFKDDSKKEIAVWKRSPEIKEPNKICTVGGHTRADQTYEESTMQELKEEAFYEIDFPELRLNKIGKIKVVDDIPNNREFVEVFYVIHPGPFKGDPYEVSEISFVDVEFLKKDMKDNPNKYTDFFARIMDFVIPKLNL
jgi:isopentenyl-diphosphate delta-isomerase